MPDPTRVVKAYWDLVRAVQNKRVELIRQALMLTSVPEIYNTVGGYGGYDYFDPDGVRKEPPTLSEVLGINPAEKVQKLSKPIDVDVSWLAELMQAVSEFLSGWARVEIKVHNVLTPMWVSIDGDVVPLEAEGGYYVARTSERVKEVFEVVDLSKAVEFVNNALSQPVGAQCPCLNGCVIISGALRLNDCPALVQVVDAINTIKEGVVVRALGYYTVYVLDSHIEVRENNYYLIKNDGITDVTNAVKTIIETDLLMTLNRCYVNTVRSLCFDVCGGAVDWRNYRSICGGL